jgi:hypothetical protein
MILNNIIINYNSLEDISIVRFMEDIIRVEIFSLSLD